MDYEKREYAKEKHGWSIEKLTGFRRTAEQIEDSQYDDLREQSASYEKKKRFVIALAICLITYIAWNFFS